MWKKSSATKRVKKEFRNCNWKQDSSHCAWVWHKPPSFPLHYVTEERVRERQRTLSFFFSQMPSRTELVLEQPSDYHARFPFFSFLFVCLWVLVAFRTANTETEIGLPFEKGTLLTADILFSKINNKKRENKAEKEKKIIERKAKKKKNWVGDMRRGSTRNTQKMHTPITYLYFCACILQAVCVCVTLWSVEKR